MISSLILTLSPQDGERTHALAQLHQWDDLILGDPQGLYIPAVLCAENDSLIRLRHKELEHIPGVVTADVVGVYFEDEEQPTPPYPTEHMPEEMTP